MSIFGIYTGHRSGDILKLRIKDVKERGNILIKEQKTGKMMRMEFSLSSRCSLAPCQREIMNAINDPSIIRGGFPSLMAG